MESASQVNASQEETNIRIARLSFELWEARDFAGLIPILHESVELIEVAAGTHYIGRDGLKEMFEKWASAYPDGRIPVTNSFASGEQVTLEWNFMGTNTGEFREGRTVIPATGKHLEYPGCSVIRVVGGKVRSIKHYWDQLTIERQLNT